VRRYGFRELLQVIEAQHRYLTGALGDVVGEVHWRVADRSVARRYAHQALAAGDPTGWFERLYQAAERGQASVPWADLRPNPHLLAWAAGQQLRGAGQAALVAGCGLGDDAEALADLGFAVTAFDIAGTAIARCRARFPGSPVRYQVADLLAPPAHWRRAFAFVFEAYTLQVLVGDVRRQAISRLAELVAPGGRLLVVTRGRSELDPPGAMPWPLTRAELDQFIQEGLDLVAMEDYVDDEHPPVRRLRAHYHAPAPAVPLIPLDR
jgi:SAM-dependent methyltransferase